MHQGVEPFDCKAIPLTPASNGALRAPQPAAGHEGARKRGLLQGLLPRYYDQHSQLTVGLRPCGVGINSLVIPKGGAGCNEIGQRDSHTVRH